MKKIRFKLTNYSTQEEMEIVVSKEALMLFLEQARRLCKENYEINEINYRIEYADAEELQGEEGVVVNGALEPGDGFCDLYAGLSYFRLVKDEYETGFIGYKELEIMLNGRDDQYLVVDLYIADDYVETVAIPLKKLNKIIDKAIDIISSNIDVQGTLHSIEACVVDGPSHKAKVVSEEALAKKDKTKCDVKVVRSFSSIFVEIKDGPAFEYLDYIGPYEFRGVADGQ